MESKASVEARMKASDSRLEFFQKHIDCDPKRHQRCKADACWGAKRYNIRKARGLPQKSKDIFGNPR
jgi:hypothetical protein